MTKQTKHIKLKKMKKILKKLLTSSLCCDIISKLSARDKRATRKNLKKFKKSVDKLSGFCYNETPPAKNG